MTRRTRFPSLRVLLAAPLILATPTFGAPAAQEVVTEESGPLKPSYCRMGGCLYETYGGERAKLRGRKKVKRLDLARIACGHDAPKSRKGEVGGVEHVDGRRLLDKEGNPKSVCNWTDAIYTLPGKHTLGIDGQDFELELVGGNWYSFYDSTATAIVGTRILATPTAGLPGLKEITYEVVPGDLFFGVANAAHGRVKDELLWYVDGIWRRVVSTELQEP